VVDQDTGWPAVGAGPEAAVLLRGSHAPPDWNE
jgi:hypothetical protein